MPPTCNLYGLCIEHPHVRCRMYSLLLPGEKVLFFTCFNLKWTYVSMAHEQKPPSLALGRFATNNTGLEELFGEDWSTGDMIDLLSLALLLIEWCETST